MGVGQVCEEVVLFYACATVGRHVRSNWSLGWKREHINFLTKAEKTWQETESKTHQCILLSAIRYLTIEIDQKFGNNAVDSKLFILWRHKASQRILIVVVVIVVLSPSRWGCKVCALPFWSGRMFYYLHIVPYIANLMRCGVARCGTQMNSYWVLL